MVHLNKTDHYYRFISVFNKITTITSFFECGKTRSKAYYHPVFQRTGHMNIFNLQVNNNETNNKDFIERYNKTSGRAAQYLWKNKKRTNRGAEHRNINSR